MKTVAGQNMRLLSGLVRRIRLLTLLALVPLYVAGVPAQASASFPEWSTDATDVTPAGSRTFLGQFLNDTATLTLSTLPSHSEVTVSFDAYIIQSWDGNEPDEWDLSIRGGPTLLHTTFSNVFFEGQAYPDPFPGGNHPAQTGAAEVNSLGYSPSLFGDSVYHLSFTFPHSDSTLILDFSASGLAFLADESWGLDNVEVRADDSAVYSEDFEPPAPPNDEISNATIIASLPFTDVVNAVNATSAPTDPSGCSNSKSV